MSYIKLISILGILSTINFADNLNINFASGQNPRIACGFASTSRYQAQNMLAAVTYQSVYVIDTLESIVSGSNNQDSIASLLNKHDETALTSHHKGPVCQYFVVDMAPVHALLGGDSITGAHFKWSGEVEVDGEDSLTMIFFTRQAGHPFKRLTAKSQISLVLDDTNFVSPHWFKPGYFLEKELAVRVEVSTKDSAMCALRTDFVEIIFHTSAQTQVQLRQVRESSKQQMHLIVVNGHAVKFAIEHPSAVSLNLFDLNGTLKNTVHCGFLEKGTAVVQLSDFGTIAAGRHIMVLQQNGKPVSSLVIPGLK